MEHQVNKLKQQEKRYSRGESGARSMDRGIITENARVIDEEIAWLLAVLDSRIAKLEDETAPVLFFSDVLPPDLTEKHSAYADLVNEYELGGTERLLLICSLVPHISPEAFTARIRDEKSGLKIKYPRLGGYFDTTFTNFVPTLQTIVYLLAGDDMSAMLYNHLFLMEKSVLIKEQIITLDAVSTSEDTTNRRNYAIRLAPEFVEYLISGKRPRPDFGKTFPATLITTGLDWEQLVVKPAILAELQRIMRWEEKGKELLA